MGRQKSLIGSVSVDEALKAHDCQHNGRHRLERGDKRLKVKDGRAYEHFCRTCAQDIIQRDLAKLKQLALELGVNLS